VTDTATVAAVEHKRSTVRPDKGDAVAELTESFTSSAASVLTEYRGLTVKQISELRRSLGADTTYAVVKNTLSKIAARNAGLTGLDALLAGPTAVAFVTGDPVAAAKSLREFAKTHPALIVKGGVMDGKAMTADEIKKLADLESREVLLAKLAGAMKASLTQAVSLFAAPLSQAARAFGALEGKAQQDPSVLAGGSGAPEAQEDSTPAPEAQEDSTPAPEAQEDSTPAPEAQEDSTPAPEAQEDSTPAPEDQDTTSGTHDTTSETHDTTSETD